MYRKRNGFEDCVWFDLQLASGSDTSSQSSQDARAASLFGPNGAEAAARRASDGAVRRKARASSTISLAAGDDIIRTPQLEDRDADDDDDDADVEERRLRRQAPTPQREVADAAAPSDAGVVSLNVTSSPTPSRKAIISPFGSPSTWIGGQSGADSSTSDVHINGDHVTQVRVDASSVLPATDADRDAGATPPPAPLIPPPPLPVEEDRDQEEQWTHFAAPAPPTPPTASVVSVVHVEPQSPSNGPIDG